MATPVSSIKNQMSVITHLTYKNLNATHSINRMKDKNHMIMLINAEKAFDKTKPSSLIKNS